MEIFKQGREVRGTDLSLGLSCSHFDDKMNSKNDEKEM